MLILKYLILGIIQGFTEPLPISSSGHLRIFKSLFNSEVLSDMNFEIIVNFGSLIAILILYRKEIASIIKDFFMFIKTKEKTYLIEVNYYNSGGSKLNEVARAYADVAPKINQYDRYEFVWITDGQGWFSAKNKLEEAFNIIPKLYNLTTIDTFVEQVKSEGVLEF